MKVKKSKDIFTFTSSLKVLAFLAGASGQELLSTDIQKVVNLSRAGIYLSAKEQAWALLCGRIINYRECRPILFQY